MHQRCDTVKWKDFVSSHALYILAARPNTGSMRPYIPRVEKIAQEFEDEEDESKYYQQKMLHLVDSQGSFVFNIDLFLRQKHILQVHVGHTAEVEMFGVLYSQCMIIYSTRECVFTKNDMQNTVCALIDKRWNTQTCYSLIWTGEIQRDRMSSVISVKTKCSIVFHSPHFVYVRFPISYNFRLSHFSFFQGHSPINPLQLQLLAACHAMRDEHKGLGI